LKYGKINSMVNQKGLTKLFSSGLRKIKGGEEMKKSLMLLGLIFGVMLVLGVTGFVYADSSDDMVVKANVLETEISISVPDQVSFGNIAPGYTSERQEIEIVNDGTVDVGVSADLEEEDDIFENIAFRRVLDDPLTKIDFFEIEIEKPSTVGDENEEDVYMYLDLSDYEGEESGDMMGHNATVIFTAVPL